MENSLSVHNYLDPQNNKEDFELKKVLAGLELESLLLSSSSKNLSGGQKTKLALAKALLNEPDILLLDEPTNFLDIKGKKWVMNFLSHYPKTLILISHDINLLDKYIDKVIAINTHTLKIEEYHGNYTKYLFLKKQKDELLKREVVSEKKHILQMKKGLIKMARYTSEKGVRQRTQLKKRIQRIVDMLPDLPPEIRAIHFKLPEPTRAGEVPLIAKNIHKSFGDKQVLTGVSLSIKRQEHIALIGPNGVGKSTLIKILMGLVKQDKGEVEKDVNLKIGYYSQEFESFDMDLTIVDLLYKFTPASEATIRPLLARFLFSNNKIFQKVSTLSGGEKTRLAIALLLLQNYNLLILDEPTTYLDVMSQRVILEALKQYQGAMLIVSHTEDFIKGLKPTRTLLLPENKLVFWSEELTDKISLI